MIIKKMNPNTVYFIRMSIDPSMATPCLAFMRLLYVTPRRRCTALVNTRRHGMLTFKKQ